mmetsp:Transcript_6781/g.12032  ORF Transcript_6781/g.12032 Transcript_6781/m.12032 type:complete len:160 (+) Transcript_6781:51-530(+)|eukprot:CAMPEP_0197652976 /NCGR_PEP_ID=MMETSP1338-20131121/34772_1 /TAXON_ID=43686 ORGANISM="Pelagodinium beii, Strain RCC1491" /NCGR_SAMPLE_ID=MMETSP1338 /ASSEMBLY_ACC=CAM_ASM_000754 /LENGTH=159 /DNA_ID=CAMNT_0043227957 /DNA_START=51 /DNA_END=530 /DNA_ORIENTATION=-
MAALRIATFAALALLAEGTRLRSKTSAPGADGWAPTDDGKPCFDSVYCGKDMTNFAGKDGKIEGTTTFASSEAACNSCKYSQIKSCDTYCQCTCYFVNAVLGETGLQAESTYQWSCDGEEDAGYQLCFTHESISYDKFNEPLDSLGHAACHEQCPTNTK